MKTKKRLATFVLISVVLITGCMKDKYLPVVGVCPEVVSTIPVSGAVGVLPNQVVSATFNVKMNPATINASSLTLSATMNIAGTKAALVPIEGVVTYSDKTATFTPATPLVANTTYTGRVTTAAKDPMGNAIKADYVWKFNTGVAPTVISTDPAVNATGILLNKVITASFSVPMDPLTLSTPAANFTVKLGTTEVPGTVAYTGTTASFTPTSALLPNSIYMGTITTGAKSLTGIPMVNNYVWSFNTGASPTVISTDPANIATGVFLNKVVTAVFSMPMDPLTMIAANVTLKQGTNVIAGAITYSGSTLTFTPTAALTPNTVYTGTITTGAKNLAGIPLAADYVWNFNTGLSPIVISTDPINLATGVVLNKVVAATFSVPMDYLTLTPTTFTLKQGVTTVPGAVTYSGTTASFTPTGILLPGTEYTGTITTAAKSLAGIPLAADFVWKFTTGVSPSVISTDPINLATGVVLNKIVSATFSVPMDYLTITGTTFTLKQGVTLIAGAVTYNGTVASFTPTNDLLPGLIYTGTITTGAKSLLGVPLAANYVWTFTTGASPTVTATDPLNLATGVALNKVVTATFSLPMNPATLNGISFSVKQGIVPLVGTVSYNGTTLSFKPSVDLLAGTAYTATITTDAKSTAGIPLAANYVWTFNTGVAIVPTVTSTDPINLATGVVLNKEVTAMFSVPMDPLTLNGITFTVKQGLTPLLGAVSYNGTTASFTPSVNLIAGTVYTGTIAKGAKSLLGTPLAADYVWTFTTVAAQVPKIILTDPNSGATGVELNKTVVATFDMAMDPATLASPATTFTLKNGLLAVPGIVSYSLGKAYFKPSGNLLEGTTYTAKITTGAKNLAGTPIAKDSVWTFTTMSAFKPVIDLKTAGRFGILANTTVTNNAGFSVINNLDVGISAGARSSVTGFPPATIVGGAMYAADDAAPIPAMLTQAKLDLTAAYLAAEGATAPAPATVSGDQGGLTLAPGIYKSTSTLLIQSGNLTLDGKGDPNATWIFQIASDFTTVGGAGGNVILTGGAQAKNIFWQVGSSATIGDYTVFYGNVLALTSITMNSHATATGRMLAQNGAVVMTDTNTINKP